ncbi:MAG TPA: mannose-1-phosphate guanylyltransferase [Chlamydiales bacterium]|nr:mannose-1-phosphate guanylyltransferase [Chlamydiales bacterium]
MQVVILAGGGGTRLWPLSKKSFPKQFMHFGDGKSLLQKTVIRFLEAPFVEEILISTNALYAPLVETQISKIDPQKKCKLLIEPASKNTAGAICLAIKEIGKNCPILISPADHFLEPPSTFYAAIEKVIPILNQNKIITFGIKPIRPETGYGYIKLGKKTKDGLFEVSSFVEKPPIDKALRFLQSQKYLWNSGMFAFTTETFWKEMQEHAPEIVKGLSNFSDLPNISIDYALMEKTKNIVVLPLDISWSDIGSWDRVYDLLEKDENQNVTSGNVIALDTKNSLILGGKKLISTIGLEDILIVETDDALFIAKKGHSEKVRRIIEQMEK